MPGESIPEAESKPVTGWTEQRIRSPLAGADLYTALKTCSQIRQSPTWRSTCLHLLIYHISEFIAAELIQFIYEGVNFTGFQYLSLYEFIIELIEECGSSIC